MALLIIPVLKRWSRARGPYGYLRTWNWPITAREIIQPYNIYNYGHHCDSICITVEHPWKNHQRCCCSSSANNHTDVNQCCCCYCYYCHTVVSTKGVTALLLPLLWHRYRIPSMLHLRDYHCHIVLVLIAVHVTPMSVFVGAVRDHYM